jgi:hypothetical protein
VNILVIATPHEDLLQEEEYGLSITSNTLQATKWKEEASKNQQDNSMSFGKGDCRCMKIT